MATPAAIVIAVIALALLVGQLVMGWEALHSTGFFTSLAAHKYVWANALTSVLIAAIAIFGRARWRLIAIAAPATFLLAILIATATAGGQVLAMITAAFTMTAAWDAGERMLRRLGANSLSQNVLVAWLAGIAPWSLGITLLGRLSLVKWWSVGILLLVLGTTGAARLCSRLLERRSSIAAELTGSPVALASGGLILLTLGWSAIYTAAPEIQYDALYGKAYLPETWARTGHITSNLQHVQDAIVGWFQLLATSGHLFGATAVGRYMQLIGLMAAAAAVWWWGRRHGSFGPLAAVAVVVTPQLIWQASTADDDLLLALSAFAFCVAIVTSLRSPAAGQMRRVAFALGLMAGTGASLKLHLVPLFALLLLGWALAGRSSRTTSSRLLYSALGSALTALPPLVLRWVDTGNPILPAYNNIFRSRYWLPINETLNFPYWAHPGPFGPVVGVWKAVVEPSVMSEAAPPGAFGLLVGAVVLAVLLGWLGRGRSREARFVWFALVPSVVFWWISFRYLRYLLAIDVVAIGLLLILITDVRMGARVRVLAIGGAVVAVSASFPLTIAHFWNVPSHKPPVYAAIGKWSEASYESAAAPERQAVLAFNALSRPGARMASDAFERVWLTDERDLYNLHYEVLPLMELRGPAPTTGDQAFAALSRLGIEWVMVSEADRLQNEPGYLSQVITTHGKDEFSERGWDLYRLVAQPPPPIPVSACDTPPAGVGSCWGVRPPSALTASATRVVPACAGETLALTVSQAGGGPSAIVVRFIGGNPANGFQPGESLPGLKQTVFATAPAGATQAEVTITPGAGARITTARVERVDAGQPSTPICAG